MKRLFIGFVLGLIAPQVLWQSAPKPIKDLENHRIELIKTVDCKLRNF